MYSIITAPEAAMNVHRARNADDIRRAEAYRAARAVRRGSTVMPISDAHPRSQRRWRRWVTIASMRPTAP